MSPYVQLCDRDEQDKYSEPMVWIGIYVAVASFLCTLAMSADWLHVITVAMKLPMDLSSDMPRYVDQAAKVGSLAFMCTMMANFMPSLAAMDNKTLLANVMGLSILVITMIVNIFIEIYTGVIKHVNVSGRFLDCTMIACIYTAANFLLLIIVISSSLTIPISKEIIEVKYQTTYKTSVADQHLQHTQIHIFRELRQNVTRYWVMAETGSPQFVMASNLLSTASGVICVIVLGLSLIVVLELLFRAPHEYVYQSVYKKSVFYILTTQYSGVMVGAIAPICRCFSVLSFKLNTKSNMTHLMVFEVERYWIQKLCEWKQSPVHFLSSSRSRTLVYNTKSLIISFCIRLQKGIVIFCKVVSVIPIVIPISVAHCLYRWKSLKARLVAPPVASKPDELEEDLSNYVLHIHDEMELAKRTLKDITNSMNSFILNAEREQNLDLLKLLKQSTGFKGVENFEVDHVQPLLSVEPVNTWSLPIVTLTCIAVSLPKIHLDTTKSLLRSVREGLLYTHLVEESLNHENEYVKIRKATIILWNECEHKCKWLEKTLEKNAFEGKTTIKILKWFSDRAKEIIREITGSMSGEMTENTPKELIAANSMCRIVESILLRDESNTKQIKEEQLFALLNGMIADILCACFTNIPRVIIVKCHESAVEKREASVKAAAKLLGKTRKIIERLETCELPSMDPHKMAYIDDWRLYLKQLAP